MRVVECEERRSASREEERVEKERVEKECEERRTASREEERVEKERVEK